MFFSALICRNTAGLLSGQLPRTLTYAENAAVIGGISSSDMRMVEGSMPAQIIHGGVADRPTSSM